jgi:hypothetical protein
MPKINENQNKSTQNECHINEFDSISLLMSINYENIY